jgi:predicted dehydrogenase
MRRVKIAVVGAGLISQVEHIPNLIFLKDLFDLIAVVDPSAATREHITNRYGITACSSVEEIFPLMPEAVVVGAPDAYHSDIVGEALARKMHVFCEKPLALSVPDITELILKRDASGCVLQVGYMKRWDPSYELLLKKVAGLGSALRFISVEVNDPDSWPYVDHHSFFRPHDLPERLRSENLTRLKGHAQQVVGRALSNDEVTAYTETYSACMIHDLNAVMGLLDEMRIRDRRALGGAIFANGKGASAVLALNQSQAICQLAYVSVPKLADYNERISLFFEDRRFELTFPSPYLNNFPTRLVSYTSDGSQLQVAEHRNGFHEPFVRELVGFWGAIVNGEQVRNTAEQAREDMVLIAKFMALALGTSVTPRT